MIYGVIGFLLLFSIALLIILSKKNKEIENKQGAISQLENLKKEDLKSYFKEEWKGEEEKLTLRIKQTETEVKNKQQQLENNFNLEKTKLDLQLHTLEETLKEKEKRYNEVNQDLDLYKKGKIKEIDGTAAEYEQHKRLLVDQSIDKYRNFKIEYANTQMAVTKEEIAKANEELQIILKNLEEERSKRAAINEEIRRQREVAEQQDFYRIQLQKGDEEDVEILRSITGRLRHPEAINKVIWSGYYQKPLAELRKRVAIEGSGIYKITRIKTGEIYIGQAVNVSTRWADHVKTALGVGTLASSQLHRVMSEDGCENFTFELLEETPKEKLKERESYYIDFYDSKNYGLNSVRGEQK